MIIECPECQTRFRMADDKIKPEGTKVRCSRCRHIFAVTPEEPTLAAPAPPPPAAEPPLRPAADFSGAGVADGAAGEGTDELSLDFDPAPPSAASAQEEFSADALIGAREEPQTGAESGEPAGFSFAAPDAEESTAGVEFSFDAPEDDSAAEFALDPPAEEEATEFSFAAASPDDADSSGFPFGEETPADQSDSFSLGNDFSFAEEESASGIESGRESFGFDENPPPSSSESEDFDFSTLSFGEEEPAAETAPLQTAEFRIESPPVPSRPEAAAMPYESEERPVIRSAPVRRRQQSSPAKGVLVFVLLLLLGLGGVAGYLFWQTGELPDVSRLLDRLAGKPAVVAPVGQIRVSDLNGYFVTNPEAGPLFVIQGNAVNEFREARSAIAVKGVLYNKEGQAILQQTVFPGNRLNDEALQTLPFAKIEESMNNQFGDSLSNLNVGPGKAIPFSVVFRNLPADLAEFTVEVTDSRPGSN